ncbi:MAG: LLM class flavin-dependent oxidoreductase [Actinophytocola sp.]|uniref:LLM class flavin-dependent oxidoreductase n=1 Tax=Actinophytocola sp. TaxID=1872138 RepID=UPI001324E1C1|nr:LLM class flavin-dependent oxidoreductase [Actinophytocola sp.]MPZ79738.1 LLM class flavin-dependent oxidoreductase [Actinophytocola sp.]
MRIAVVLSDGHPTGVDPKAALAADLALLAAARDRLDGVTLRHGWGTAPRWNPQVLTTAAYLSGAAGQLAVTVHGLPLGVRNPIELAEQLATVDHAWSGRTRAGLAVGTPAECASHGIDPAHAADRFAEGLRLLRSMWTDETVRGTGPGYVFDEVRPTLRPVQPSGPPLSLAAKDGADAETAARLGLGLHAELGPNGEWEGLVGRYRSAGGSGELSLTIGFGATGAGELARLAAAGVDQVDVRVRAPGADPAHVMSTVDELAARGQSVRKG